MNLQYIDRIIQQGEGLKIEFKETSDSIPKSFYETVGSFSNTDGGTILLGVDDHGNITGIQTSYVEGDQRIDLRDKIFREVIGNIIVHREYTSAISTDLIISESEVILTNPNKPLFHGAIDPGSFNPYPKNPNIRKFFTAFGWTDEIGSGIRNTYKYIPLYVSGAKPLFIENDIFTTIIPLQWLTLSLYAEDMLKWFELPSSLLPHLQKGLATVPLSASLKGKSWSEILLHLVPGWHKKGTQLSILNWPEYQLYEKELANKGTQLNTEKGLSLSEKRAKLSDEFAIDYQDFISEYFKKVPGSSEKGAKLLAKKSFNLILILTLTAEPIKIEKMMEYMGYKKRQSFRELYLIPLQQAGLVSKTNPEKSNDPDQQYILTDNGRAFLGNYESTPKSQKPLNPLKGTLKSSLIFNEFPFRGQG